MRSGTLAHSEQVPKLQVSIESDSTMALSSLIYIIVGRRRRKKVFVGTFFCTLPNRKIPSSFHQTNSFLYKFIYKN
jgi:hypothetical protein